MTIEMLNRVFAHVSRYAQRSVWAVMIMRSASCASLVGSMTQSFSENLAAAILDSEDPGMVRDGAPSFLLLIDSLIAGSPNNAGMLSQSAQLYSAYASAFVAEPERSALLHDKAREQIFTASCQVLDDGCNLDSRPFAEFTAWLGGQKERDLPALYNLASIWAGWVQSRSDDFVAIAELARVKALMQRVVELDPGYLDGNAFLYLGVFETLLPPAMGGRPDIGRAHFERAIEISDGKNLMAKVMYASQYARLMFDQELHDKLLNDVIKADVRATGLTLTNTLAKEQAQELLDGSNDYF